MNPPTANATTQPQPQVHVHNRASILPVLPSNDITTLAPLEDPETDDFREIGGLAVWSVSSCKAGFGVRQLRDNSYETYWQSDSGQPHLVNIQFPKKVSVKQISIFLNHKADESYTPQVISIRAGTCFQDLQELKKLTLNEPDGWIDIKLTSNPPKSKPKSDSNENNNSATTADDSDEESEEEINNNNNNNTTNGTTTRRPTRPTRRRPKPLLTFYNTQTKLFPNKKTTKKLEPKPLKTHFLQVAILSNHQNGKDTHVRQIKVFAPKNRPLLQDDGMLPFTSLDFEMSSTIR